ncbi:MAG: DUF4166 domain-containing protein [Alphaproteobacteria bacterium]
MTTSLFRTVLGPVFEDLPPSLKVLHSGHAQTVWNGQATTRYDKNILAGLIRKSLKIHTSMGKVPITVTISAAPSCEKWERSFDGKGFKSQLSAGKGRNARLMIERFGPLSVAMAIVKKGDELHFIPRRWFILGCPMPKALLPRGTSFEYEKDGIFHFDVEIRVPLAGVIAAYKGSLTIADIEPAKRKTD